jgi:lysophospholipase L1-like esterase
MSLPQIFVIGDSISMQYGPYLEKMAAGQFGYARKEADPGVRTELDRAQGANGGDSSMVLDYISAVAGSGRWKQSILLLNCGLHDIKTNPQSGAKQVPLTAYEANLKKILTILQPATRRVIWIRTTPAIDEVHNSRCKDFHRHAKDVDAYNACADAVMRKANVASIDLFSFTKNLGGPEIFCDHVHYTEAVREKQAAFIAGYLNALRDE